MRHFVHAVRRLLLATAVVAVLVGFVTAFASAAAKPNNPAIIFVSPSPDEGTTTTDSVTLAFTYNRTPKATKTLTCSLSGPASYFASGNCANLAAFGSSGSQSTNNTYSNLAIGDYTFTVSLTLTDGGTVTATRPFNVALFEEVSPIPHVYAPNVEWNAATQSSGETTAALQPAGGIVLPPTPTPSSASGCSAADFAGFVPGRVALIQRGSCPFGVKVLNAEAAGATGVVIFNEGQPGRTDAIGISLIDANGNPISPTIPVGFTSFTVGNDLFNQYQASAHPVVHLHA